MNERSTDQVASTPLAAPSRQTKRHQLILAFAVSALATASAVASGFASTAEATSYRWSRGESTPSSNPQATILDSSPGFSPLLLSAQVPATMQVSWSCNLPSVAGAEPRVIVATQWDRASGNGLTVQDDGNGVHQLFVRGHLLTALPQDGRRAEAGCVRSAHFARSGQWSVEQDGVTLTSGTVDPPAVTGITTDLEPGQSGVGFVELNLTTVPHGPSTSALRSMLRLGSIGLTLVAVGILLTLDYKNTRAPRTVRIDGMRRGPTLDHLFVASVLVAWWLLGPVHFDDGWVLATVTNFASDGVFTSFYDTFNSPIPLGYFQYLLLRGWSSISHSLLWLRMPSVVAGVVTWIFVRSTIDSLSVPPVKSSRWGHPAAAAMFSLSWISWNGTLRPEPLVASLVAVSLWACVRFIQDGHLNSILVACLASALAISIHPGGIVSLAPVVVAVPALVREVGRRGFATVLHLGTVALIALAMLGLALGSVGDYGYWAASANSFRVEAGHSATWLDESSRYKDLFGDANSSSTRRISVLLPLMSAGMFFLRRRDENAQVRSTHVAVFLAATALLALTPSKWFWHFGTLTPLVAMCVGIEASSWNKRRPTPDPERVRLVIPLAMAVLVNVIGWRGGFGWNVLALLELEPTIGPLAWALDFLASPWVLTAVLSLWCVGFSFRLRHQASLGDALKQSMETVGASVIPATAALAVCVSMAAFAVDALLVSPLWSLPRQNLEGVTQVNCGLADQIHVSVDDQAFSGSTARSPISLQSLIDLRGGTVLVAPQIRMYFPCIRQPTIADGVGEIPSVVIATGGWPVGLPGNPYHLLPDVAELTTVAQVFVSPNYAQTIDVTLVDLRGDTQSP